MTLRSLFYLLVAANVVFGILLFGAPLGLDVLSRKGEPERLSNQLHPERIRVLREQSPAAPAAAPEPVAEPPQVPAATPDGAPAQAATAGSPNCVAYRGFSAQQAQIIIAAARAAGDQLVVRETDVPTPSFWVNIPAQGGREGAEKRSADLIGMGIEDFFVVQEAGPTQYAVSLGLFKNEASARRHLEALQRKGLRTARITTRESTAQTGRIELQGPSEALAGVQQEVASRAPGVERMACGV